MTDNPHAPGKIGVTIKVPESKRYAADNPWFVFEGTDPEAIKEKIGLTFGLDVSGLDLGSAVINAQRHVSGLGNVAHGLGGIVLSSGTQETEAQAGDVFAAAREAAGQQAPAQEPADPILVSIEQAKTVEELKQIWAENQAAFADAKYMDPWKARGKSLQG